MRHEIQRIEPLSAMRIGFFVGLLSGFVLGIFEGAILKIFAGAAGSSLLPPEARELIGLSGGALIMLAVIMGLLLSLLSSLAGVLSAVFYNWGARLFGGIELHLSDEERESRSDHEEDAPFSGDDSDV